MKIGIITFQRAHNFGAQMQMYALYNLLKGEGHDIWILDYHNPAVEDVYIRRTLGFKRIIYCIKSIILGYQRKKIRSFLKFICDNFNLTERFDKLEDLSMNFDLLITGSDQLWDYYITGGRKEAYFLDNVNANHVTKKISYAISAEGKHYELLVQDKEYVKKALSDFSWLSVREKSLSLMLKKEMGIDSDVVCDPTLFLTREECKRIAIRPKETKYLCVYRVNKTSYLTKLAEIISAERGLKIVNVYASLYAKDKSESYGPREILGYICYADAVLTSSFHGTVFSIINHIDFYSAYDTDTSRVQYLLDKLGYSDRFLKCMTDYDSFSPITFDDSKLYSFANFSRIKLIDAIF